MCFSETDHSLYGRYQIDTIAGLKGSKGTLTNNAVFSVQVIKLAYSAKSDNLRRDNGPNVTKAITARSYNG